jgi:parvulin-like peptidyl-prolyl isomerase
MTKVFQVGTSGVNLEDLPSLLKRYQFLPHLYRQLIIDQAIAGLECSPEEKVAALDLLYEQQNLGTEADLLAWLQKNDMTLEDLESQSMRHVLLNKFKAATFGSQVEAHFMRRKPELDQVIYSLIRTDDISLAQELYFRINEGECSFADIARQYSQGMEASTGGMIGPTALTSPHPEIARILFSSQPGQLYTPIRLEQWVIILRLEKLIPAQLDDTTRQRMVDELFERWLQKQTQEVSQQALAISDQIETEAVSQNSHPIKFSVQQPDLRQMIAPLPKRVEQNQHPTQVVLEQIQAKPKAPAQSVSVQAVPIQAQTELISQAQAQKIAPNRTTAPAPQQPVEAVVQNGTKNSAAALAPLSADQVDSQALMQMPLPELMTIVDKLRQNLVKMTSFVNDQEEELGLLRQTIETLQHQISHTSEYEQITLSVDLEAELQSYDCLDQTLQGQRQRVQNCQHLVKVHQDILHSRQNMLKLLLDFYPNQSKENLGKNLEQDQVFLSLIHLVRGSVVNVPSIK